MRYLLAFALLFFVSCGDDVASPDAGVDVSDLASDD